MQRSDLEAECGRLLGDPNFSRWSTTVIDTRLVSAEIDVLKWTNAVKKTATYTPVAESSYVIVSSNLLDILAANYVLPDGTIKGPKRRFDPISRWDLDFNRPNWQNEESGEPVLWTFDASNARVILVPKPSSADVGTLQLLEVETPTTPINTDSTTVPFDNNALMVPYHRALVYWVVSECLKDNNDSESLQKARYFRSNDITAPGEYEKEIKQILMKFDVPEAIPAGVKFQPQGGRVSGYGLNQKSNPLGWGLWTFTLVFLPHLLSASSFFRI